MSFARLRAVVLFSGFALPALCMIAIYLPARHFGWSLAGRVQTLFHKGLLACLGIRVHMKGTVAADRPLLLASNHGSWVDILALSSLMPLAFIAKSDVAGWPIFGWLARLQRSVFVERDRRGKTGEQAAAIADRLLGGEVLVLFAEGTTSDGNCVLPFRSALFGAARAALEGTSHERVTVQPVAIAYTHLHGMPLGRIWRPLLAWIGGEDLMPHMGTILSEAAFDMTVRFGEPIIFERGGDRKRVAQAAEDAVRHMLCQELTQR
ncbi:lysophospholipid acyltransferase family protein [Oryzibacter oryziterrae]|uniref:lysophospholipid acyltransferase family protein n=1 Tax=Oryzibacter oryziterrae TaxID=2766474 RepID=UPI001F23FCF5|nr:lysophospholipid acyltransferase family protein [Oryzibacter oryziterrae]